MTFSWGKGMRISAKTIEHRRQSGYLRDIMAEWRPMPARGYAAAVLVPTGVIIAAWLQPWVPVAELLRDPLAVAQLSERCCRSHFGFISNLGVLVWWASAAVCLFAALVLVGQVGRLEDCRFMAAAGVLTGFLTIDDLFLLHDHVLPNRGVPEKLTYGTYAAACLGFLARFRRSILRQDVVCFVAAGALLAASMLVDLALPLETDWRIIIEDGAKFVGISLWSTFFITAAWRLLDARPGIADADAVVPGRRLTRLDGRKAGRIELK